MVNLRWPTEYNNTEALYECDSELHQTGRPRRPGNILRDLRYSDYLLSPEWRQKRRQKLNLVNYRCEQCGYLARMRDLHVHHLTYERLGDENLDEDLEVLCRWCHHEHHQNTVYG